jgi:polyhydroxybutyrate depolymerase
MKTIFTFIISALICTSLFSQQETRTLTWDGTAREYIEYVPSIYNAESPAPVVFCLHGLGDNMTNFSGLGFHQVANQKGWIVITPQALVASIPILGAIGTAWNSGAGGEFPFIGYTILNQGVDDAGFLIAILDSLENHYNINTDSVFFMGFSMGGFMSNRMAIEHGDRINAVASVSGTIGNDVELNPTHNLNTLHFHGTADSQVRYEDAGYTIQGFDPVPVGMGAEQTVDFWRDFNNCDNDAIVTLFPDTKPDGKTFERYLYLNGDNDSYTAFIKVIGGDHEWYYFPNNDIDYTSEIYKFFTNTMDFPSSICNKHVKENASIYPNPAKNFIRISSEISENSTIKIFDISGKEILSQIANSYQTEINISGFAEGIYIVKVINNNVTYENKIIVTK